MNTYSLPFLRDAAALEQGYPKTAALAAAQYGGRFNCKNPSGSKPLHFCDDALTRASAQLIGIDMSAGVKIAAA